MQRNALQLLAIAALVALAGCTGGLSGAGDPADGTPTLEEVSYPAGVSANGTNVSALAEAHAAALENRSFTLSADTAVNTSMMNQSARFDAAVGQHHDTVRVNGTVMGQRVSVYLTAEKRYARYGTDGEVSYRATERTADVPRLVPSSSFTGAGYLDRFGGVANATPTGVRERNGTTLIVLRADGSNATATAEANVTDYNATLLVDQRGVVHSLTVETTSVRDGQRFRTAFSMELSNVGATTVPEPAWLDEARNRTGS
jgi:hypothetical protein